MPRTRALLDLAGAPDRSLACVLIAGTKGKGSTAAFLASVLDAAGIRAGLYTSPHLQSWRERIRVGGVAIGARAFDREVACAIALLPRLRRRSAHLGEPTAFELLTVAALAHFARRRCRVAVLEVGLGGRYDATNATDPAVSVITPVGLDHREVLGGTLGRIALEKAGVMRSGRPALIAPQRAAALPAVRAACRASGARCSNVQPLPPTARLGIAGDHQRVNAALARSAALALGERGIAVQETAIRTGLRRVRWPARFEYTGSAPRVVLDGAHTPESAAALASTLRAAFPRRRVHFVFGCTAERDPRAIARPLRPVAAGFYVTAARGPRAMPPVPAARALGAEAFPTLEEAIDAARRSAGRGGVVCVTGSLALAGEAREALGLPVPERLW